MAFVKGQKRAEGAGMKKGHVTVRNRDTAEAFERIVAKYGDPMDALAEMAFDSAIDLPIRQNSMKEIMKYGYAQRKAVELSGPNGDPVQLDVKVFDNALDMLKNAARKKTPET
jgi:hypothetical protein